MDRISWENTAGDVYHEAGKVAPAHRLSLSFWCSAPGVTRASMPPRLPSGPPSPLSPPPLLPFFYARLRLGVKRLAPSAKWEMPTSGTSALTFLVGIDNMLSAGEPRKHTETRSSAWRKRITVAGVGHVNGSAAFGQQGAGDP